MNRKIKCFLGYSLLAGSATVIAGEDPVTGSVALTSDYVFRGISQTQEKPAIQGGLTYTDASGLHFGLWGSNINFKSKDATNPTNDNSSMELDVSLGYGGNLTDALSWDLAAAYYSYPGTNVTKPYKYGFWEGLVSVAYDLGMAKVSGLLAYSPDFFGGAERGTYFMLGLDVPLPADFALNAHVGGQWLKEDKETGLPQTFVDAQTTPAYIPKNYSEWKVGISKEIAGVGLELAYMDTSLNKDKCLAFAGQEDLCDSRAVLTISKSF
jgi:uncharacterized protein (TIGR02001 family)